jgi:mono/diheme cytochrome c family protein
MRFRVGKWSQACARIAVALVALCCVSKTWCAPPGCAAAAKTFSATCSMCHMANGKGNPVIKTADFTDPHWQAAHKDAELISAISKGVAGTAMPSFKGTLSSQQIADLLHCVIRDFGK